MFSRNLELHVFDYVNSVKYDKKISSIINMLATENMRHIQEAY